MAISPFAEPLDKMTIKRVDFERTARDYQSKHADDPPLTPDRAITFIIETHNEPKDPDHRFEEGDVPGDKWGEITAKGFRLRIFTCAVVIPSSVGSVLGRLDVQVAQPRDISYLFFLYRFTAASKDIFALCRGSRGYLPVQPYASYTFPRQIAFRVLNPAARTKENSKRFVGAVLSSQEILRGEAPFDPNTIQRIVTGFTTHLRPDASLLALNCFDAKRPPEVDVQEGGLRFCVKLSFEDYAQIADLFAKIVRGEATYRHNTDGKQKKRKREEDQTTEFAFLNYFVPVPAGRAFSLDGIFLQRLARAMLDKSAGVSWDFCHPHYEDYYLAHEFRLRYARPDGAPVVIDFEGARPSFSEVVAKLKGIPHLKMGVNDLKGALGRVYFGIRNKGGWDDAPLAKCFIGQLQCASKKDHRHLTYFKFNGQWYEISERLLERVDERFRALIVDTLLKTTDEGHLPHPWEARDPGITPADCKKKLGGVEIPVETEVAFLDENGKVLQTTLLGEALSHHLINFFRKQIEPLLKRAVVTKVLIAEKVGSAAHAETIWNVLTAKRRVVEKREERIYVLNPFTNGQFVLSAGAQKALEGLHEQNVWAMDEGAYNESYLYDKSNKGMPYTAPGPGWLVGDRILPQGIELFDVLRFAREGVWLYHVKEAFGQKTRDACSQLQNSARLLADALSANKRGKETILEGFYREATKKVASPYREKVRKQMMKLGKEAFLQLFQGDRRKIVFVYAFVDDRVNDRSLSPERVAKNAYVEGDFSTKKTAAVAAEIFADLKKERFLTDEGGRGERFNELHQVEHLTFSDPTLEQYQKVVWKILVGDMRFFGSLIGRMDLLHTRAVIEEMGFTFKLVQIQRTHSLDLPVYVPGLMHSTVGADDFEAATKEAHGDLLVYQLGEGLDYEFPRRMPTLGDGSCAFHALLGADVEGTYQVADVAAARKAFADHLRADLNDDGDAFKTEVFRDLYQLNMEAMLVEAAAPSNGSHLHGNAAKLIEGVDAVQTYLGGDPFGIQVKLLRAIVGYKGVTVKSKLVHMLKEGDEKNDACLQALQTDDRALVARFAKNLGALKVLGEDSRTYSWLSSKLEAFELLNQAQGKARKLYMTSEDLMKRFLQLLLQEDYWLSTDELQMLAHMHGIRVEIIAQAFGGDYEPVHPLPPRDGDLRPLRIVHANGVHYSRCLLEEEGDHAAVADGKAET